MDDFRILKWLDRFKGLFLKAGIEYDIMRKILQIKLLLDGRRIPTIYQNAKKPKKEGNYFIKSLWIHVVMSIILIPFIVMGENYMFQMSIVFSIIMFILLTTMIADYSSVLLDIRDKSILNAKPIKRKTINAAKTIHVCIYMFYITLAISVIPMIAGTISHGVFFLVIFVIELLLTDLVIIFMTALFYFTILRFFDGEKLKDIINYVQIGLSVVSVIGYQLVGRAFDLANWNIIFHVKWWNYLLAPIWYAAPFEVFLNGNTNQAIVFFMILALVVPILTILLYIQLMPSFEKNLQKLAEEGASRQKNKQQWSRRLSPIFCYSKEERTFFEFASLMMKKERDFKLKVYPSLAFAVILPFIFIVNMLRDHSFESIRHGIGYLSIYSCMLMIPSVSVMIKSSGKYKGAWVFKVAPLKDPSPLFRGTFKAFIIKLFLPLYLVLCIPYTFIFGIRVIPSLIVVFISSILYALICFRTVNRSLPFSEPIENVNNQGGFRLLPLLLIDGIFIIVHLVLIHFHINLSYYMIALLIVTILYWQKTMKVKWDMGSGPLSE